MTPLEEIKFHLQTTEDAKRVLLCNPADQLTCEVYTDGNPLITIQTTLFLDPGTVVLLDVNALEASHNEAMQHWRPTFHDPGSSLWSRWRRFDGGHQ